MIVDIIYDLKWKNFNFNVKSRISNVIKDQCFCDVILVSGDKKPFQAHRYVLSAFSPVLKNILQSNPHSHPLIYLRGLDEQELDSILRFIYLGETTVNRSNMYRFSQAVKDLRIKKLVDITKMDDLENNYDVPSQNICGNSDDPDEIDFARIDETG